MLGYRIADLHDVLVTFHDANGDVPAVGTSTPNAIAFAQTAQAG